MPDMPASDTRQAEEARTKTTTARILLLVLVQVHRQFGDVVVDTLSSVEAGPPFRFKFV